MTFAQLLKKYTDDMTLARVAELCADAGHSVHPTYLSKLRTGDRPAPDDEQFIRSLAQVCGKDPEPLLLLARYEREPHAVMEQVIDRFVRFASTVSHAIDEQMISLNLVRAMIDNGAGLDSITGEFGTFKDPKTTHGEELAAEVAEQHLQLMDTLELLSDPERLQHAQAGTAGTLATPKAEDRLTSLVDQLADAAGVSAAAIRAGLAAAQATSKA